MIATAERRVLTVTLAGRGVPAARIGAKAATLDRLIAMGANVPPCGVVTTDAYADFVAGADLGPRLDSLRDQPLPPPSAVEDARRDVDRWFLDAPMPPRLAAAITSLARDIGRGGRVAVRSSATLEDLESVSFAGQYRTSLGVDPGDVVRAVRLCFASLWHPEPRTSRRFHGIEPEDELAMAALVMPMLDPTWAGVLFTEDPSDRSRLRIEMVPGLGEALVAGTRTPGVTTAGRDEIDAFDARPEELRDLVRVALDLEGSFGTPLDLEWALEPPELWLLQARPITTGRVDGAGDDDGLDVALPDVRYTTAGIAEMLPGVMPPRLWDSNSWLIEEGFRSLFTRLGADTADLTEPHALVGRIRGRAALDLDRVERIVASIPGGSVAELEHQYFGDILDPDGAPAGTPVGGSRLLQGVRTLRARTQAFEASELVIQAIEQVVDDEPAYGDLDDPALLAFRGRVLHLGARAMEAEIGVAATASAGYRGLEIFLREQLGAAEAAATLRMLTTSERSSHRGRRSLVLDELSSLLDDDELVASRATASWPEARAELESSVPGREFLGRMTAVLRRAGSTSVFGGVTWDEIPEAVWPTLRAGVPEPGDEGHSDRRRAGLAAVERRITGEPQWRSTRVLTGQIVDVRRRFLRREANDAAAFLDRREHAKASLLMLGGVLRRIDGELGRRLAARGELDDPADIDYVTGSELAAAIAGRPPPLDLIERRRRRIDAARFGPPLPRLFRGRPAQGDAPSTVGDLVHGWSGSPGRYEGPARVVDTPRRSGLRRGEVLVARNTDASWLPLFHIAGAVVVEQGGPLSHAAILARELGMPAVLNVPGLVERVRAQPGALLTVDGDTGEVAVHGPSERDEQPIDPDAGRATGGGVVDGVVPASRPPAAGDAGRLGVFITGLIGAGALMSIAIGLTQAIGGERSQQRIRQRAKLRAASLAAGTLRGFGAVEVGRAGLRPRGYYAWLATMSLVAAVLALWLGDDYVEDPGRASSVWLLGLGLVTTVTLVVTAAVAFVAVVRWPVVSPTARRLSLPRGDERRTPAQLIGRVHASLAAALLLGVLVIAWFIAEAEGELLAVDKWVFDRVGAGTRDNWWHPEMLDEVLRAELQLPLLGGTTVLVPLAILLVVATYRCRPLMFTYPLAIAAAGLVHVVLQHFVKRDRPELGLKPGFDDSFPGGHANELTLILGLLPIVVYVLTRKRWLRMVLEVVCAFALALALADTVRVGDHWPSDNMAGFLIGAAMVLVARGVARAPALHARCRGCPAQEHGGAEEVP